MTIRTNAEHGEAAYHDSPGVTFHRLKDFLNKGPRFYYERYVSRSMPSGREKDWGTLGRAYHIYGLEGEQAFREQVIATPETYLTEPPVLTPWNSRTKYCKEWTAAHPGEPTPADYLAGDPQEQKPWNANANICKSWLEAHRGQVILSPDEYDAAFHIGRNMRADPHAARLLAMGWPEITIEQPEPRFPVPVKGRIDWLASTSTKPSDAWAIADPKGTVELEHFEREAFKFGYHRQMAWYRKLVRDEIGLQLPAFLVALEKEGMHRCRVYQVDTELLDIAEAANNRDLDRLAEHYAGKPWTLDHDDRLRVLTAPTWMKEPATTTSGPAPWEE
jgi:hypothetical protein